MEKYVNSGHCQLYMHPKIIADFLFRYDGIFYRCIDFRLNGADMYCGSKSSYARFLSTSETSWMPYSSLYIKLLGSSFITGSSIDEVGLYVDGIRIGEVLRRLDIV